MSCQVVNSQSQVKSRLPSLPQTLPTTQAQWNSVLSTLNQWGTILQQPSHPPNVIPSQFQTFTTAAQAAVIAALTATGCTPSVDATQQFYGGASLKVVAGSGSTLTLTGFPISIAAATRWFGSFQILATAGATGSLTITTNNGHSVTESFTVPASASWQQVWGLFDLRQFSDTQATWEFTFSGSETVWLDGLQMNAVSTPLGTLPKFAGTQMVTGALAYASNLDGVPDGSTYQRFLASGLSSGIADTAGLVANAVTGSVVVNSAASGVGYTSDPLPISVTLPSGLNGYSVLVLFGLTTQIGIFAPLQYYVSTADLFQDSGSGYLQINPDSQSSFVKTQSATPDYLSVSGVEFVNITNNNAWSFQLQKFYNAATSFGNLNGFGYLCCVVFKR